MKKIILIIAALTLLLILSNCQKTDDNLVGPDSGVQTLTMVHFGVDWSEGKAASSDGSVVINNPDGETIGWCPNGNGGGWGIGVWYRAFNDKVYRIGPGNLSDVASIDTSLWSNDVCATPLANGDLWAAQCQDGYVAFKVINAPADSATIANDPMWSVEVEYVFSASIDF